MCTRGNSFSSSASFDCPLTESDITGFLGSSGLSGLLNGGSSKLRERRRSFLSLGEEEASAPTEQERLAMHLATRHALAKLVERGSGGGGGGAEEEGGVRRRAEKMFVADRFMRIGTVRLAEHSSPSSSSEEEARDD